MSGTNAIPPKPENIDESAVNQSVSTPLQSIPEIDQSIKSISKESFEPEVRNRESSISLSGDNNEEDDFDMNALLSDIESDGKIEQENLNIAQEMLVIEKEKGLAEKIFSADEQRNALKELQSLLIENQHIENAAEATLNLQTIKDCFLTLKYDTVLPTPAEAAQGVKTRKTEDIPLTELPQVMERLARTPVEGTIVLPPQFAHYAHQYPELFPPNSKFEIMGEDEVKFLQGVAKYADDNAQVIITAQKEANAPKKAKEEAPQARSPRVKDEGESKSDRLKAEIKKEEDIKDAQRRELELKETQRAHQEEKDNLEASKKKDKRSAEKENWKLRRDIEKGILKESEDKENVRKVSRNPKEKAAALGDKTGKIPFSPSQTNRRPLTR